jgi:hypothetical protein
VPRWAEVPKGGSDLIVRTGDDPDKEGIARESVSCACAWSTFAHEEWHSQEACVNGIVRLIRRLEARVIATDADSWRANRWRK